MYYFLVIFILATLEIIMLDYRMNFLVAKWQKVRPPTDWLQKVNSSATK